MISPHFQRSEFACKDGCGFDTVDIELIDVLEATANYFADYYDSYRVFIHINSGCRCVKHNDEVQKAYNPRYIPGSSKSMHTKGQAADFYMEYISVFDKVVTILPSVIADYLEGAYSTKYGIGRYPDRIHLDVKTGGPRRWTHK